MKTTLKTIAVAAFVFVSSPVEKAQAGIPVIDGVGLVQHIMNALENMAQTMQMIQSYQAQLMQFENQLRNTLNPDNWVWGQAQQTIGNLLSQVDNLRNFRQQFGSLDDYLSKYRNIDYYSSTSCLSRGGCSQQQMKTFVQDSNEAGRAKSEAVRRSNDTVIRSLDKQQDLIQSDAAKLKQLQQNAMSAQGQMAAIQSANQLASNQSEQLLQIRMLMVSQQAAATSMAQADADTQSLNQAASEALRESRYAPSPVRGW
jgi:P-type conjugative transfer protein TrbJ